MLELTEFTALQLSSVSIVLLLLAAFAAGYIDTLVGGGGLITIPALLAVGVPPIFALGTNKLQACVGSGTASITLLLGKQIQFRPVKWSMVVAFVGALLGAIAVQYLDAGALKLLIPIIISLVVIYFMLAPVRSLEASEPKLSDGAYRSSAVPAIGFYDGMFGPATGSFFVLAGVTLKGQGIVYSTMVAKTLNFATNVASLLVFVWFGKVLFAVGCMMMVGQFFGARLGARALLTINPNALRGLVVITCLFMLVVWLYGTK